MFLLGNSLPSNLEVHTEPKAQSPVERLYCDSLRTIAKYPDTIHLYTDGSVCGSKAGIGIFNNHYSECLRLPDNTSIYTAEAYAIYKAIGYGLRTKQDTTVFTDSFSCLAAIQNRSEHPIITRIMNMLYHSSLNLNLVWIPSHCNVFGNEQADRLAKRAVGLRNITSIRCPKDEMLKQAKKNIRNRWERDYAAIPMFKIKEVPGKWDSSYHSNRLKEVVLARLRLGCVRCIHLIPRIEGNYGKDCECGEKLTLSHIFFECHKYNVQRQPLINMLRDDNKLLSLKNLLEDNLFYGDQVYEFIKNSNLIDEI